MYDFFKFFRELCLFMCTLLYTTYCFHVCEFVGIGHILLSCELFLFQPDLVLFIAFTSS